MTEVYPTLFQSLADGPGPAVMSPPDRGVFPTAAARPPNPFLTPATQPLLPPANGGNSGSRRTPGRSPGKTVGSTSPRTPATVTHTSAFPHKGKPTPIRLCQKSSSGLLRASHSASTTPCGTTLTATRVPSHLPTSPPVPNSSFGYPGLGGLTSSCSDVSLGSTPGRRAISMETLDAELASIGSAINGITAKQQRIESSHATLHGVVTCVGSYLQRKRRRVHLALLLVALLQAALHSDAPRLALSRCVLPSVLFAAFAAGVRQNGAYSQAVLLVSILLSLMPHALH